MYYLCLSHRNDISEIPLSKMEEDYVSVSNMNESRKKEWARGRMLLRRLIHKSFPSSAPVSIINNPDGSPAVKEGPHYFVSLSHEIDYFAAIVSKRRKTAIDLCSYDFVDRLRRILFSFRIESATTDPVQQWVSLECLVKLRKLSLLALRQLRLHMELDNQTVCISGASNSVFVNISKYNSVLMGYAVE